MAAPLAALLAVALGSMDLQAADRLSASARQDGAPARPPASPLAPQATLDDITARLASGDVAGARRTAAAALAQYPADASLHNLAGVADAQAEALPAAEAHFRDAIRLAPRAVAAYENLGRLYQQQAADDPSARTRALETYRRLLRIAPSNVEGLYQAALLLVQDGSFGEARRLIERLPARIGSRPQALAVRAAALAGTGASAAADRAVRQLAADPSLTAADVEAVMPAFDHLKEDAVPAGLLDALDRRGLATAAALHRLGQVHARHERYREAREVLERAAAAGGVTVPLLLDLARATDRLGDHEGALGYLARARDLEPENASVHFLFGIVCVELNLGSEAYESLRKAVALAPEHPLVNYAMGAVSMHRREPSESIPYFEKYLRLNPSDPRGRFALGVARFHSGQLDAAAADLREAVQHPQTAAGAHYFLGRLARQSNDLETARREVEASLRLYRRHADAWAELGLIQVRGGQYAEAERSLAEAVSIDPDNYAAAANLAVLYGRTRDPRRDAHAARLEALQEKRTAQAQEFLRLIEVVR